MFCKLTLFFFKVDVDRPINEMLRSLGIIQARSCQHFFINIPGLTAQTI